MIINTGGRTDTVQYYTPWLLERFRQGFVYTRNPLFPSKVIRYELDPSVVDCVVFCSKNYRPILPHLREITDRFNTYFFYTITAYGRDIEPNVPLVDESIETLAALSLAVGRQRVAWRYDPVLLSGKYTVERHLETFRYMAEKLAPNIDRCIFSFVEMYRKLEYNFPSLIPLSPDEMNMLACGLGRIAAENGIHIQACGTDADYSRYGIHRAGCMTLEILGRANNVDFRRLRHRGMRKGCHCIESRDIGAYDSCPNGCRYCYANTDFRKAEENYRKHDPSSPLLIGCVSDGDEIIRGVQKSFLKDDDGVLPLF